MIKNYFLEPIYDEKMEDLTISFLQDNCYNFLELKNLIDTDIIKTKYNIDNSESIYCWKSKTKSKNKIIKGFMQSGKTNVMITMSLYYIFKYRISTCIVIQNSLDAYEQIKNRIKDIVNKYLKLINEHDDIYKNLCKRNKDINEDNILEILLGAEPSIIILLNNNNDIKSFIKKIILKRFILMIDESDFNDSGSEGTVHENLQKLKDHSNIVWNITATPLTSLLKEDIDTGSVFVMKKPENYKDIPMFDFVDLKNKSKYCKYINDDPFQDENIKEYLHNFSKLKTFYCSFWKQEHPRYSLIRIGTSINSQIKLAKYTYKNYGFDVISITYNGGNIGITLRGKNLPSESIQLDNNIVSKYKNNVHRFKNCHIGKIITYLNKLGIERIPRIVIFAGKMADRGITFTADNYQYCKENKKILWHLTEMYLISSKNMIQPNLLQTIGRLCGIYNDNIPLTVYSNCNNDIIKSYHIQEELIERSRMNMIIKNMKDIIPIEPISKNKCIKKRKIASVSIKCKLNEVEDDTQFGGWDWKQKQINNEINNNEINNNEIKINNNEINIINQMKFDCVIIRNNLSNKSLQFFDNIYDNIIKENLQNIWIKASTFYRTGAKDQQRCHHLYQKQIKYIPSDSKYLLLKQDENSNYQVYLRI